MQYLPGKRALVLVLALAAGATGSAYAQDTTETSETQSPPGYRGMERDTTMFPDSGGPPPSSGAVEDRATGTYDDSTWQDTTGTQNPAGYRGMGRLEGDSANADTTAAGDSTQATGDSAKTKTTHDSAHTKTGSDSTKWGYPTDSTADVQNPPGYRGMERPESDDNSAVDSTQVDSTQ